MGNDTITVATTTDSQEAVNVAAGLEPEGDPERPETVPEHLREERPAAGEREPQPRKNNLQKRFDKLTAEKYALEERLRKVEEAARNGKPIPQAQETEKDGSNDSEYVPKAEVERKAEELLQRRREAEANARENERIKQIKEGHDRRVTEALNARPDREQVLERAGQIKIHPWIAGVVMSMPNSEAVTLHLIDHPEDNAVLHQSPTPEEAIANVVRISERLASRSGAPAPRRPVSRAPAPQSTVRGSSSTVVNLDEADYQTYKKEREQQARARRR